MKVLKVYIAGIMCQFSDSVILYTLCVCDSHSHTHTHIYTYIFLFVQNLNCTKSTLQESKIKSTNRVSQHTKKKTKSSVGTRRCSLAVYEMIPDPRVH